MDRDGKWEKTTKSGVDRDRGKLSWHDGYWEVQRFNSIDVQGKPCAVIRGKTMASLEEVELWLRGLDRMVGAKYFVVLED